MALTERQQQIQDLLEQGKSAKEIAEALGITTNGVYQQLRRMRAGGASAKPAKRGAKAKPAKSAPAKSAPAKPPGVNESTAPPRVMTPLQAIRARRDDLTAGLREAEAAVTEAQKALEKATQGRDKIAEKVAPELESLDRAERAIRGESEPDVTSEPVPVPAPPAEQPKVDEPQAEQPKVDEQAPAPAKPSNSNAKAKPKPAKQAPAKPAAAQTPQPATQAEREATADPFEEGDDAAKAEAEAAQAAAEAQAA
jgi:F0F1-type ATP synthase membrane subunit b/b'